MTDQKEVQAYTYYADEDTNLCIEPTVPKKFGTNYQELVLKSDYDDVVENRSWYINNTTLFSVHREKIAEKDLELRQLRAKCEVLTEKILKLVEENGQLSDEMIMADTDDEFETAVENYMKRLNDEVSKRVSEVV